MTREGDGTVVWPSADYMGADNHYLNLDKVNTDSENRYEHVNITETSELQSVINSIITERSIEFSGGIQKTKPNSSTLNSTLRLSVHSPVDIAVSNDRGEKVMVQKSAESKLQYPIEEIRNSTYIEFGEGKYIFVPADGAYDIDLKGTGTGTFSFEAQKVSSDGEVMASTTFQHLPVATSTEASVDLDKNNLASSTLSLDYNGDGDRDKEFKPGLGIVTIGHIRDAITKAEIDSGIEKAISVRVDSIEEVVNKGKFKQVRKKAERLIRFVKKHSKVKSGKKKKGKRQKINSEGGDTIVSLLGKFKDRLYEK